MQLFHLLVGEVVHSPKTQSEAIKYIDDPDHPCGLYVLADPVNPVEGVSALFTLLLKTEEGTFTLARSLV